MRTEEELRRLATPEFSRLLAADPELRRLNSLTLDRGAEGALLFEVAGFGVSRIGRLPVRALTAAKWSLLWLLESPFVVGGSVTETDCDLFLYLLRLSERGGIPRKLYELPALASGICARSGLSPREAAGVLRQLCDTAFRPLEFLPPEEVSCSGEAVRFDALWLTRIAGIAAREANVTLEAAIHDLPLATLCCCYVNRLVRGFGDARKLCRRPNAELARRISARIATLEEAFLNGGTASAEGL